MRKGSKSYTQLAFADLDSPASGGGLSRSKTTSTIQPAPTGRQRRRQLENQAAVARNSDASEWLYRAGTTIASQAQKSKGQSWLVSRASSTSLAAAQQDGPAESEGYTRAGEDDISGLRRTYSTRAARDYSRVGSRAGSRAASALQSRVGSRMASRLGSRAGSRANLARLGALTSVEDSPFSGQDAREEYFDSAALAGPDFVDGAEEDDEADERDDIAEVKRQEEEVARLAKERGFGLGSMVDRLVGWSLFDVKEKGHRSEEESDSEAERMTEARKQKQLRKAVSERLAQSTVRSQSVEPDTQNTVEGEEASGWQDAAWLMSVASKVLF